MLGPQLHVDPHASPKLFSLFFRYIADGIMHLTVVPEQALDFLVFTPACTSRSPG